MASACVNKIGMSPEKFLDGPATFPWLTPRMPKPAAKSPPPLPAEDSDSELSGDFEFQLDDPVNILPADELFSDGKLVPLHFSARASAPVETRSPENPKVRRKLEISNADPCLYSPKAPRCSSRWKDLLGLKKLNISSNAKTTSSGTNTNTSSSKSLKLFRHRISKSTGSSLESSLSLPLLPDSEFVTSARLSLSSSSSGSHEPHDDLPRHSLDSDRPKSGPHNPPRVRMHSRHRTVSSENPTRMRKSFDSNNGTVRGVSVDSPRMNSSGRVIFQGLERSSSSPSSLNGGPRLKYRGMERSYSANVRVTPVLNVPVCSLMGSSKSSVFGIQLFPNNFQKKETSGGSGNGGGCRGHVSKTRAEKT